MLLENRVCIVTGAASGIGEATAMRFLDEGAEVYLADIAYERARDEGRSHERPLDVTSIDAWTAFASEIEERHGRVDVLFNNAGTVSSYDSITDVSLDDWDRVVRINQTSVFYGMRIVIPLMQRAGKGSIINMSSLWGYVGTSGVAAYQASKGAVMLMSKNAAMTYAADGIRVNSIHPGFIVTPMTLAQDPAISDSLVELTPMKRAGRPEEIAAAVTFLASDEASFITGVALLVDGGIACQ